MRGFWDDDSGGVIALEYLLLCAAAISGVSVGVSCVTEAMNDGLRRTADTIRTLAPQPPVSDRTPAKKSPIPMYSITATP